MSILYARFELLILAFHFITRQASAVTEKASRASPVCH